MRQLPLQYSLIWHSYLLIGICGILASAWFIPAICSALALLYFDRRIWKWQRLTLAIIIFIFCSVYGNIAFSGACKAINASPAWLTEKNQRICAIVRSVQGLPDNRLRILLAEAAPLEAEPLPGLCAWTWETPQFMPLRGQKICITRPIKPVSAFANYEQDSFETTLFAQKIFWRIWSQADTGKPELTGTPDFFAKARESLRQRFLQVLWPAHHNVPMQQERAILLALLFGDRQYLDSNTVHDFASATLAHSLALSGQHLSVVALLGLGLVWILAILNPRLYLKRPRAILVLLAGVPLALLYLWLGNSPASLQRAAAMLIFMAIWLWLGRPFSGQDLLCGALLAILALNPLAAFDSGLQMPRPSARFPLFMRVYRYHMLSDYTPFYTPFAHTFTHGLTVPAMSK